MGFEITLVFHPRKESGGYDMETKKEEIVKVGRPFDETSLERLAGVVMSQMARRDIFVLSDEVKVIELIRNEISFKECKDGKGIVLKNKKFSFNEAAQMVAEDLGQPDAPQMPSYQQPVMYPHEMQQMVPVNNQQMIPAGVHPHELLAANRQQQNVDDLYNNPNKAVPIIRQGNAQPRVPVNQKKILYHVYFEPIPQWVPEARRLKLKFSADKKYPVHQIIPSPTGRLDAQRIAVTDDSGKVIEVDEKFFSSAGIGLVEDQGNRFSGSNARGIRRPKLAFEDDMFMDNGDANNVRGAIPQNIPVDNGAIPDELLQMPDIRPNRRR